MDAGAGPARPAGLPVPAAGPAGVVGLTATELAARARSGGLSAVEVVGRRLRHPAAAEARIGGFPAVRAGAARAGAGAVDPSPGRAGLPLSVQPIGPPGARTRLSWLTGEPERFLPWWRSALALAPRAGPG